MIRLLPEEARALRTLLRWLDGFEESTVYEDYKEAEGFTDAEWDVTVGLLQNVAGQEGEANKE